MIRSVHFFLERINVGISEFLKGLTAGSKSDDADELAAAIARLLAEKSAAETQMVAIAERRTNLLLEDDDTALDKDERASEKAYRTIEKVDLALSDLRARLAAAKSVARRARWSEIKARFDASLDEFAATYRLALEAYENLAQVRHEAQGSGFAEEARGLIAVPHFLTRDLLHQFESESARYRAAAVRQIKLTPREVDHPVGYFDPVKQAFPAKAAPKAAPAGATPKAKPAHERIAKGKPAPVAPPVEPKPFKAPKPDEDGNVKITVIRAGLEIPGRARPRGGETIALPAAEAMRVVRSGAADFAEAI